MGSGVRTGRPEIGVFSGNDFGGLEVTKSFLVRGIYCLTSLWWWYRSIQTRNTPGPWLVFERVAELAQEEGLSRELGTSTGM